MIYLKLLLIRHAQSLGNIQKRMEGQSSTTLSPKGRLQAKQLARRLLSRLDHSRITAEQPIYLYSSPLLRALRTAQYLSVALRQAERSWQIVEDSQLKEIHQGIFQGLTWSEAQASFPELCARLMSTTEWQPVPGAESPQEARLRSHRWFTHILNQHRPGETIWVVSHGGFMMHLIAEIRGQPSPWETPIAHTATFEFVLSLSSSNVSQWENSSAKCWRLHRFNQLY